MPAAPAGLRCAGLGRDGLGTGAGKGREGAEGVDVDYALCYTAFGDVIAIASTILDRRRTEMFNVDRFVAECRAALTECTPELAIKGLLERAVARPADVEAALGEPSEGRIKPLHHSPELTIIQVVWTPGLVAWPHDHRMWAVIGLYGGREDNTFYRRAPEGLAAVGDRRLEGGDVAVLGQDVIHSVENPLRCGSGSWGAVAAALGGGV